MPAGTRTAPTAAVDLADALVDAWGSWGPTVDPDCRRIAFVSDRSGTPCVWVHDLPVDGAAPAPVRLHVSEDPVVAVSWSADGAWLAVCAATDGGVRTQVWVVRPDGSGARLLAGSRAQHAELGPWTRSGHRVVVTMPAEEAGEPTTCYLADPATGVLTALATGELISVLDLSVDQEHVVLKDGQRGRQFCVVVDRDADEDHPLLPYPATGSTDRAIIRPAPAGEGDGGTGLVAYVATDAGLPRRQVVAVPLGERGWRGQAGVLAPREDAELEGLDADDAGRLLLLVWNVAGTSELQLYDTRAQELRPVPGLPGSVVSGALLSRDGSLVLLAVEGPRRPRELWSVDVATLRWSRVTDVPALPDVVLVEPSLEHLVGRDGLPLTGWLYRVPGQRGPGPAVLSLHGGPEAQERPTFNPQHQAVVAAGIAVFAPNIRGSSGFGRAFVHADDVHGRRDAFDDVLACRDHLLATDVADPGRIAVAGRSYGGYLTLAMLAFSPGVFTAGVDICGMSDLHTFYRDTEPWIAAAAVTKYGHPEHDRTLLRALSPLHAAANITVPLLVVHGELDTNVPLGEATQVVAALRALDRPVEYLQLDGEGHEYRRADSRKLLDERLLGFLVEVLGVR
ncbi:Dipeptidyl aminopeptidase/acylaminoacyl peptidase [Friedmanniella luteola]|uniref:Dipeptidyl aminopeptidase/acylaminoacyl peptidase n=1 Tax=Friedmanniella luteola TaxID=546871 RepID=A0A1H1UUD7_9ACTN|nr:prolyl oligopeptidase family serine peptidase [Friedmanniella luteola]SDS75930.1 Dipeptidyl aminopeptidase/acylaminoacyl peptidase [Friedmanniella luteola]